MRVDNGCTSCKARECVLAAGKSAGLYAGAVKFEPEALLTVNFAAASSQRSTGAITRMVPHKSFYTC